MQNLPVFSALGDETRQKIILLIMDGTECNKQRSVAEIAKEIGLSRPTISHHLKILREVGIVTELKSGTKTYYQTQLSDYIGSLERLLAVIKQLNAHKEKK